MSISSTVLVAGYGPLKNNSVNPAWETARRLDGKIVRGAKVTALQVPANIRKNLEIIETEIVRCKPSVIIGLGLAPGRAVLTLERSGLNILDFPYEDVKKNQPMGEPVVSGGPSAYLTTIPIKAILKRMREAGIPSAISYTAGTHGCNQILYWMLHYVSIRNLSIKVGFIHLPYLPEQIARMWEGSPYMYQPSMSLELMTGGTEIAIETSLELTGDIEMGSGALC